MDWSRHFNGILLGNNKYEKKKNPSPRDHVHLALPGLGPSLGQPLLSRHASDMVVEREGSR